YRCVGASDQVELQHAACDPSAALRLLVLRNGTDIPCDCGLRSSTHLRIPTLLYVACDPEHARALLERIEVDDFLLAPLVAADLRLRVDRLVVQQRARGDEIDDTRRHLL